MYEVTANQMDVENSLNNPSFLKNQCKFLVQNQ